VNHWKSYSGNINIQHSFKEGENLLANIDYIHYANNQPVLYYTSFYIGSGTFVYDQRTRSGNITQINIVVSAVDYTKKISGKVNLEAGVKGTWSTFNNNIDFEKLEQNTWVKRDDLSADYKLFENYAAANKTEEIPAGGLHFRPRKIEHAFWNGSDKPLRFINFYLNQNFNDFLVELFQRIIPDMLKNNKTFADQAIAKRIAVMEKEFRITSFTKKRHPIVKKYGLNP